MREIDADIGVATTTTTANEETVTNEEANTHDSEQEENKQSTSAPTETHGKSIKFKEVEELDNPCKNTNGASEEEEGNDSDDTATESYEDDSSEDGSQYSYEDDDEGRPLPMPPLKYARIMGALPRDANSTCPTLSMKITSSAIGRIVLNPSTSMDATNDNANDDFAMLSGSRHGDAVRSPTTTNANNSEWEEYDDDEEADRASTKVHHVLALGFENGTVRLFDVHSGGSVLFGSSSEDSGAWFVNPSAAKRRMANLSVGSGGVVGGGSVNEDHSQRIVALSFDSTSSYLAALNANGDAAIFGPLVWGRQSRRVPMAPSVGGAGVGGDGSQRNLSSFLSSFAGGSTTAATQGEQTTGNTGGKQRVLRPPFALTKPPTSTVRFTYVDPQKEATGSSMRLGGTTPDETSCHPTCMALDPSYGRRKERALIVGFDDGRLVLSKLQIGGVAAGIGSGFTSFFGGGGGSNSSGSGANVKKVDSVLYQGLGASTSSYAGDQNGIEVISWRGGMIAWADSSGVRLFDIESMSRVAHIDRPTGARSNLYPTISALRPSLVFERSDSLLIAWGDCLMAMLIREVVPPKSSKDDSSSKPKRKTVECTMAWELDCVACGLTPMDEKHVAVLGLLPSPSETSDAADGMGEVDLTKNSIENRQLPRIVGGDNILELQIINRFDGKSISNDKLPLLESIHAVSPSKGNGITTATALDFSLLSSFAIPRMDDTAELEAMNETEKESIRRGLTPEGSELPPDSTEGIFLDMHLRWNMSRDICSIGATESMDFDVQKPMTENEDDASETSDCSICSDDYVFALSAPINDILSSEPDIPMCLSPPTMVVLCSHDVCLVQTRDVDDVISYARSMRKPALALKYALAHRREVRRHGLDHLVDEYFIALLRMGRNRPQRALSFPRLKIAAQTMPILLGGDARMWQRWIFLFARIPGGLFLIRDQIPVRDPALPGFVFEMTLEKMLEETCTNILRQSDTEDKSNQQHSGKKMADIFLETLRAWGNTHALRRRIQLHRYCSQSQRWSIWQSPGNQTVAPFIRQAEKDLNRRISQTAFGCLPGTQFSLDSVENSPLGQNLDSSSDSLFDVEHMIFRISEKLRPNIEAEKGDDFSASIILSNVDPNLSVAVEAMAELELMRERFDRALGYYLAIGCWFMNSSLSSLEEHAVRIVNHSTQNASNLSSGVELETFQDGAISGKFDHVLSLVEIHQLYSILLNKNYHFADGGNDTAAWPPIICLIRLVGLAKAGRFLMESISPPEDTTVDMKDETHHDLKESSFAGANLPLDLVATQLKTRPKLLYWFLYQVFTHKPELYVKFPTTAVPPIAITDLHRVQFSLFVDYAEENKSEATPALMDVNKETPFMSFLKAALPYAGVQPENARKMLEAHRGGRINSPVFARELAFVIEKFGRGTEDDAQEVLDLYLRGVNNLYLAVAFAERNTKYSSMLWRILVEYCTSSRTSDAVEEKDDRGALFGSLLEAAAHCGADLASLVSKIPTGMAIEGLREKLISSVIDYRHKVKIHEKASKIQADDKVVVLRELTHLSRRGERVSRIRGGRSIRCNPSQISSTSTRSLLESERAKIRHVSNSSEPSFSLSIR